MIYFRRPDSNFRIKVDKSARLWYIFMIALRKTPQAFLTEVAIYATIYRFLGR